MNSWSMMRMQTRGTMVAKRAVNISLNSDLLKRARAEGLNLSALTEQAVVTALARIARERFDAEVAQACRAHDEYLAEYGSLGDAVRAMEDAGEQS
jgi:antitoxin CcdA